MTPGLLLVLSQPSWAVSFYVGGLPGLVPAGIFSSLRFPRGWLAGLGGWVGGSLHNRQEGKVTGPRFTGAVDAQDHNCPVPFKSQR